MLNLFPALPASGGPLALPPSARDALSVNWCDLQIAI